jgi:predicted transcriptional regulator
MERALEDVAFLARSPHRVRVLESLTRNPQTRSDLRETTGASRATVGRILTDFTEREWAEQTGRRYHLTPVGERVAEAFLALRDAMVVLRHLRDVARWFPLTGLPFDPACLADARVTTPTVANPAAHFEREASYFESADELRLLVRAAVERHVELVRDRVRDGDLRFHAVVAPDFVERARTSEGFASLLCDVVAAGGEVWLYEEPVPYNLVLADDTVLVWACPGDVPHALVESEDPAVVAWATDTVDTFAAAATPLSPSDLRTIADDAEA